MTSTQPVDLRVDLAELGRLQAALQMLADDLAALGDRAVDADAESMGSAALADAVDDFVTGWRDGRARIVESLDAAQRLVALAVADYTATEADLQASCAPAVPAARSAS